MGKFDVLSNGLPFSMDKTKNYVKRDDGTVEEILDLANLANTEVGFIGHKANIHKAELTDRNISVLDEQKVDWDSVSSTNTANTIPIRDTNGSISTTSLIINTTDGLKECGAWNSVDGTYDFNLINGTIGQLFQESYIYGKASGDISNGDVVMFAGAQGDHIVITKANASTVGFKSHWIVGIATQDILNGDFGYVTWFGKVHDINTNLWNSGTILYFDPSVIGGLTSTQPTAPNIKIIMAAVLVKNSQVGSLMVRPSLGYYLNDLHDVYVSSPTNGDTIVWNSTNGRWEKTAQSSLSVGNASTLETHSASYFATASGLSSHTSNTSNPHSVTAAQVGLGNVTNESKATMFTSPTFTGTVSGVTASMVGLGNVENKSSSTIRSEITSSNVTTALGFTPLSTTGTAADSDKLDGQHGSYYQPASSAITTSNIGSQSVSYASSAGNADTLDGNHASAFQAALVSGSNLKTVGGSSLLGSGDVAVSAFPAGTAMLFAQTAAPTGWTKSTTHDNKALRVVSGTAGSGGSTAFTSVFASRTPSGSVSSISGTVGATTLTTTQMPSHTHGLRVNNWVNAYSYVGLGSPTENDNGSFGSNGTYYDSGLVQSIGGGGSHTHSFSGSGSLSMSAMDFAVQYVDVIIATKD